MQQSAATCVFIPVRTPAPTTVRAWMLYRGRGQRVEKNRWYPWNLGRPDAYAIRIFCLPSFVFNICVWRCYIKLLSQVLHSPMSNDFLNVEIDPVRIVDDAAAAQVGALVEAQLSVADKRTTPPPPSLRGSTDRGRLVVVLVGTIGGGWGDSVLPVTDRLPPLLLLSSPSLSYPPPTLPSEHIFDLYGTFWRFITLKGHITTILQIIFNLFRPRHLWHHTQAGVLNIYEVVEITVPRTPRHLLSRDAATLFLYSPPERFQLSDFTTFSLSRSQRCIHHLNITFYGIQDISFFSQQCEYL
ncbi:hypothetical protein ALC57_01496 [Trachymyrmex cornetzi]|uniref:Uncharacterized protein n=1 Tax=Trachymyrmex cornetzi TaxID=471704 RepID=A0A151JPK7_9HYME|nr:hypothetical protein ALC57_01496 [Trachymyrmex cornetzi]